jgi:hypothetical protein
VADLAPQILLQHLAAQIAVVAVAAVAIRVEKILQD